MTPREIAEKAGTDLNNFIFWWLLGWNIASGIGYFIARATLDIFVRFMEVPK